MAQHRVRLISAEGADAALLGRAFARIRAEAGLPDAFPPEVLAAAERAAEGGPPTDLPDLTALPFFTIDPVGSMDLDQAIHLERRGDGHRLRYAIADVPVVVPAGGPVDAEARRRGQTVYCPDVRVPLHPPVLSEGAASLLPGQVRPAYVWQARPRRQRRGHRRRACAAPWCAASTASTTRACSAPSTPGPATSASSCCARSAPDGSRSRPRAAA
ncbi:hypothetical protein GCM10025868_41920 [Angustibacter aerolatus]|uniref:RNB domain-containing protein n=1 Tax=Angustibacter aerolatus TaxID=1162965 RepID=A0ABQ6JMC6_9ACTN|nr:RNB domain-containing ribonuclease [Angustibacter aerolatus]GMA88942.1 hypothetical protein GCM10025868_41920 [Angustibacter aerolatus]